MELITANNSEMHGGKETPEIERLQKRWRFGPIEIPRTEPLERFVESCANGNASRIGRRK